MDGLERKIRNNQKELDTLVPDVELWLNISQEIPVPKKAKQKSLWVRYRKVVYLVAACFAGMLVVPSIVVAGAKKPTYIEVARQHNPDFAEIQKYYHARYEEEYASLQKAGIDDAPIQEAIQQLEADFEMLKDELSKAPEQNRPLLVDQMIQNMNNRVELLNLFYSKHKSVKNDY